jgi:hypothetical protein
MKDKKQCTVDPLLRHPTLFTAPIPLPTPSPTGGEGSPTPRLEPFLPPVTTWTRLSGRPAATSASSPLPVPPTVLPRSSLCLRKIQRVLAWAGAKKQRGRRSGGRQREMSSGSPPPEQTRLGMATGEEEVVGGGAQWEGGSDAPYPRWKRRGRRCDNPPRKILYYRLNQSTLAIKRH